MARELKSHRSDTIYKFLICHGNALTIVIVFIQMQHKPNTSYYLMVLTNFLQGFYLLEFNVNFFMILSRMHMHFVYINKSLEVMGKTSIVYNFQRFRVLRVMHFECFQLSKRILEMSQRVILVVLIKIFTTNLFTLYHAVQFTNGSIATDGKTNLIGILSIVSFYWDTMLTMRCIENLQMSCNQTAEVLSTYEDFSVEAPLSKMVIEAYISHFYEYLACYRLEFCIFGLFPLNKANCLRYCISVLVHGSHNSNTK
ncbi:putative gustatory receptor 58b [Haematobia irritans]|uniref:putative gustatory receptor 58b n=1 Tax=Haematobia irritans TaxID=7368 RepID=UPI003F50AEF7